MSFKRGYLFEIYFVCYFHLLELIKSIRKRVNMVDIVLLLSLQENSEFRNSFCQQIRGCQIYNVTDPFFSLQQKNVAEKLRA